jgi:hypothetical protein
MAAAVAAAAVRTLARAPGRAALLVVLGLGASALTTLAAATPASADAPSPFTCLTPTDFLLKDTTLYSAGEPASGLPASTSFSVLTDSFSETPNALGFDPLNGLLYAIAPEGDGDHVLQIDSTGAITDLGLVSGVSGTIATGGFDPSGTYWVTNGNGGSDAWAINVSTSPPTATKYSMSQEWEPTDWTYADGYLWGYNAVDLWRFDPSTDDVQVTATGSGETIGYNGAWTFANGDLGFYSTNDGSLIRATVSNPGSSSPTIAVAASGTGPSGGTDGDAASCAQAAITTPALAGGGVGEPYSATLAATGGPTPADYSWAVVSGSLPAGLSLDPASGMISGTPTTAGSSTFTVQVTAGGAFPVTAAQSYTITVAAAPLTTSSTLADGTYGTPYSATLSASGGTPPYSWSVISGSLPTGLSLDPGSGTISGTPTAAGSSTFTVQITDSSSPQQTATQQLTLTIDPAPLTAVVAGSQTYGGVPSFAVTGYTGLVNGDTSAVVSGTLSGCSTSVPAGAPPGTYFGTISGCSGLSSPNYATSYSDGGLTVSPAALIITASSPSSTYGSAPPTCSTTATSSSSVGTYPSTCSGAADPNYTISYAPGTVTVGPAALTITASSGSMTYGGTPPAISPSYAGFVNGDTASSLTTAPACSTTATSSSSVGTYPSTCSGAADPNYTISYAPGTVTVGQAGTTLTYTGPQTVSAGTALVPSATLTSPAGACQAGQTISFSLNTNPKTGAAGPYTLGSAVTNASGTATGASVSTTGWQAGAYTLTAAYAGTGNCAMSTATSPLAVTTPGLAAAGAGSYPVTGAETVKFGFIVALIPHTTKYAGAISLVSGDWWLNGSLSSYVNTSATQGTAAGTGSLYWWNQTLNHSRGGWQLAKTGVAFTVAFAATTKTTPGGFGIQISYTPVSPQPTPLPNSALTTLKAGAIIIA